MEHPSDPRYISRDQKRIGAAKRNAPPHTRQGTKLRDILISDKPDVSSSDLHHKLTRDPDDAISKCSGNQKFQIIGGMTPKEDELVRYMSNLPSYLAKGNSFSDKALNFGVLDWKRLEKWQYKQKQMSQKHNACSPSSSSTTVFSTDGSSTHSSRDQSCSPSHQGTQRPSLQSPHESSSKERNIRNAKSSSVHQEMRHDRLQSHPVKVYEREQKSQEVDAFRGNCRKFEDSPASPANLWSRQQKVLDVQQRCERKKSDGKSASETEQFPSTWKGKTKIVGSEFAKQPRDLSEFGIEVDHQYENRCSGVATSASTFNGQLPIKAERRSISRKNDSKNSQLCQTENHQHCETNGSCSGNRESSKDSFPVRTLTSPSRSRNIEEKRSEGLDGRKSSESTLKARNSSPIRRFSFTMGKMVKSAGTRDISPLCRSSSKDCVVKSRPDSIIAASDNPCSNQTSSNNRSSASPLRRLLDPILKSRASHSSEPSKTSPSPIIGTIKSCNDNKPSSASFCDSRNNSKHGTSSLQALLQVSFKNGFPLFTFAIDNENNVLAATVRKSYVPGKGYHNWTYTFFTVHEVKRKSGIWLNHGGKSDGPGYVPNVVAQMKVSDSPESPLTMQDSANDYITREFDLFAVDVGNGDHYATDFHPTNELAAIVVKLPRISSGDDLKDGQSSYNWLDLSQTFRGNLNGADDDFPNYNKSLGTLSLSATVVLPGGVHTVPSIGEISTLAQRWRSGGSCDCGGWDLGCRLRVYTNQRAYHRNEVSHLGQDKFLLFSQGGQDNEPMLSLTPFKERIYSVEFNSSLSVLQAFSICISFIDCRRPAELADPRNAVDKIDNEIGVFEVPVPIKTTTSNHQIGAPARYISYPPNSPVGRV